MIAVRRESRRSPGARVHQGRRTGGASAAIKFPGPPPSGASELAGEVVFAERAADMVEGVEVFAPKAFPRRVAPQAVGP